MMRTNAGKVKYEPSAKGVNNYIAASQTFSQDRRRLLSEARAALRLKSGTMINSRTVTPERSIL